MSIVGLFTPRLSHDARCYGIAQPRRALQLAALGGICLLSGCVREVSHGEVSTYHFKWWAWLWGLVVPLAYAGALLAKHPSTWVNGVWRPWWSFRGWNWITAEPFMLFALIGWAIWAPFHLTQRLEVGTRHLQEENVLGLTATRRIEWSDLSRIDLKSDTPRGEWSRDKEKEHQKKPQAVAVFKDGRREELDGRLINGARDEIVQQARAAGVLVVTTDDPGEGPGGGPEFRPNFGPDFEPHPRPNFGLEPAPAVPGPPRRHLFPPLGQPHGRLHVPAHGPRGESQ